VELTHDRLAPVVQKHRDQRKQEFEALREESSPTGNLRQVAALLDGLRAVGSGRVVEEVLALVVDSAIELAGADRGFLLVQTDGPLEVKVARIRGHIAGSMAGSDMNFVIAHVAAKARQIHVMAAPPDAGAASLVVGGESPVLSIACAPLILRRSMTNPDEPEDRCLGVLYLDSQTRVLANPESSVFAALKSLATEASVVIENARLYQDMIERSQIEQEMKIAGAIQEFLEPPGVYAASNLQLAARTVPCRSIGGDLVEYLKLPDGGVVFMLGDVAGKGPPAALLSALIRGMLVAQPSEAMRSAASVIQRVNEALCERLTETRFATAFFGRLSADGTLTYCNAGHNPPQLLPRGHLRRLDMGGPVLGLLKFATFDEEQVPLADGDVLVVFSDGVSEALNPAGEEFGEDRIAETTAINSHLDVEEILRRLLSGVHEFRAGAPQTDDITAMVIHFGASKSAG
jgi:serine phosphatase RsbU (regulator of sigma subunit)